MEVILFYYSVAFSAPNPPPLEHKPKPKSPSKMAPSDFDICVSPPVPSFTPPPPALAPTGSPTVDFPPPPPIELIDDEEEDIPTNEDIVPHSQNQPIIDVHASAVPEGMTSTEQKAIDDEYVVFMKALHLPTNLSAYIPLVFFISCNLRKFQLFYFNFHQKIFNYISVHCFVTSINKAISQQNSLKFSINHCKRLYVFFFLHRFNATDDILSDIMADLDDFSSQLDKMF